MRYEIEHLEHNEHEPHRSIRISMTTRISFSFDFIFAVFVYNIPSKLVVFDKSTI